MAAGTVILPAFHPYTKHMAIINKITPYNYPVPLLDDGNMPHVPNHSQGPRAQAWSGWINCEYLHYQGGGILPCGPNKNVKTKHKKKPLLALAYFLKILLYIVVDWKISTQKISRS